MSPLLARYYEIDPTVRIAARAIGVVVLTLALGFRLWLAFRKRGGSIELIKEDSGGTEIDD